MGNQYIQAAPTTEVTFDYQSTNKETFMEILKAMSWKKQFGSASNFTNSCKNFAAGIIVAAKEAKVPK